MNRSDLRHLVLTSRFLPLLTLPVRLRTAFGVLAGDIGRLARWLARSREFTNYTYRLSQRNRRHLAWVVSNVTGAAVQEVESLFAELEEDVAFRSDLEGAIRAGDRRHEFSRADAKQLSERLGRRLGWYALVRILKPGLVVETGTDKGLGSVVLAQALMVNGEGRLVTIDIEPASGMLLTSRYDEVVTRITGDSITSLGALTSVDLFIHDSDHSAEHEEAEFRCVAPALSPTAVLVSDNSHATDVLDQLSREWSRNFLFFKESPTGHWYSGAGIGISWPSLTPTPRSQ